MSISKNSVDHLRLRQFRLLDLIDKHRSLRAVAEQMNLTQPAVSQMLKELETALQTKLVDRTARGAQLNRAGHNAWQRVRSSLAMLDQLFSDMNRAQPAKLRIGANPAVLPRIIPKIISSVRQHDPAMYFHVCTGLVDNMVEQLLAGKIDLYIGRVDWSNISAEDAERLHTETLTQMSLTVVSSPTHHLAQIDSVTVDDLYNSGWILQAEGTNLRYMIESAFRACGCPGPKAMIEVETDPQALIHLAIQLNLLAAVPHILLDLIDDDRKVTVINTQVLPLPELRISMVVKKEMLHILPLDVIRKIDLSDL